MFTASIMNIQIGVTSPFDHSMLRVLYTILSFCNSTQYPSLSNTHINTDDTLSSQLPRERCSSKREVRIRSSQTCKLGL